MKESFLKDSYLNLYLYSDNKDSGGLLKYSELIYNEIYDAYNATVSSIKDFSFALLSFKNNSLNKVKYFNLEFENEITTTETFRESTYDFNYNGSLSYPINNS